MARCCNSRYPIQHKVRSSGALSSLPAGFPQVGLLVAGALADPPPPTFASHSSRNASDIFPQTVSTVAFLGCMAKYMAIQKTPNSIPDISHFKVLRGEESDVKI